jgi:poly-gamma-glutamate capsule biosynthesis protein CapA/YwtB (metallophosphatase superfamily)
MKNHLIILCLLFNLSAYSQDTLKMKLLFFGDIMQHDSQIQGAFNAKKNAYDYTSCFEPMRALFNHADLVIGNLELTLAGAPYKGYPQFSAPDELAVALKDVGVDVLVTANNHSLDRRRAGLERTIDVLDSLGFYYTGTFKNPEDRSKNYPLLIEKQGFKLALLNYTYGTNGIPVTKPNIVNLIDTAQISIDLAKAKLMQPDAIIVFMHWGNEYERHASKTQKDLAKLCFDKGASMVIGAHPHVLQPVTFDQEKNQLVAYSMGNFVSGQRVRYRDGGMLLEIDLVKVRANKEDNSRETFIQNAGYHLVWVHRETTGNRPYKMIPLSMADSLLSDLASKEQLKVFADDSREWLAKYNMNVKELGWPEASSMKTNSMYAIQFFVSAQELQLDLLPEEMRTMLYMEKTAVGLSKYFLGKFFSKDEAERMRDQLKDRTVFSDAFVVEIIE